MKTIARFSSALCSMLQLAAAPWAQAQCGAAFTAIAQAQGSGASTSMSGTITVQGVVIGDFQGPSPALRGFYIQDPVGDGNPATSEGPFVFNGSINLVLSLGL